MEGQLDRRKAMKTLLRLLLATGLGTVLALSLLTLVSYANADLPDSDISGVASISATADSLTISTHSPDCAPDLVITKTVIPIRILRPGDALTYTITFRNNGPGPAAHVTVVDHLPVGIKRTGSDSNPDHEPPVRMGRTWIWQVGTLEPGQGGVIHLHAVVDTGSVWRHVKTATNCAAILASKDRNPTNNWDCVTSQVLPEEQYQVHLTPAPSTIAQMGTSLVTATVTDHGGKPVRDGTLITFTSDSLGTFVTAQPRTTLNGVATSTYRAGTVTGISTITGTTAAGWGTAVITITSSPGYALVLQAAPTTQIAGGSSALTATVTDQYGAPVSGATVTFQTDLGNVLSPRMTVNGVATSQISSTVAGIAHITAKSGSAQDTAVVTFTPGEPSHLALQADPTSQVVGNSSLLTATVTDQFGNLVDSEIVTFATDLGSVLSPQVTVNGVATSLVSSTVTGIAHITAKSETVQDTAVVTFTSGAAYTVTLQANPTSLIADGVSTSVITATITDQFGNLVADWTRVDLTATLGSVSTPHVTVNGQAVATFTAGSVPGTATVTATADSRSGSINLTLSVGHVDLSSSVKSASAHILTRAGPLTYTIALTNSGNLVAANVVVTDPIPIGTVFVPGSLNGGATYNPSLDQIEWSGSVPAGGSVRFSGVVTVSLESEVIVNYAYVSLNGVLDRILSAETRIILPTPPALQKIYLPIIMCDSSS
jgi:uncharacterized repeat protein (TIGR01451 family)